MLNLPFNQAPVGAGPFAFAGLWESWKQPDGSPLFSCAIVTTEPNGMLKEIHNRMPVILPRQAYDRWLDPGPQPPRAMADLLRPYPASEMAAYAVSTRVNNPRNDSPDCIEPAGEDRRKDDEPRLNLPI